MSPALKSDPAAEASALPYDVEAVRADFPILSREVYGKPLVFLDNAASAQKPRQVIDAVSNVYETSYSNVHRGLHFLSNAATDAYEAARGKVARFLNAGEDEIVFTKGSTEAINLVATGFVRPRVRPGDEIVITEMEHHANIVPWHMLREELGVVIRWVPVGDDGSFSIDDFEAALSDRTRFVSITHMSNVTGTVVPVRDVVSLAHARNIPVMVDGSQGAVHLDVDVKALGCDLYCFTGHKLYGPSGVGVLYGEKDRLAETRPYQGGGEMIVEVTKDTVTYAYPPARFEAGTPPIAQAIGLGAAIDYVESIGRAAIHAHEDRVGSYAAERLRRLNSVRVIGEAVGKGAIFSIHVEGVHAHDVSMVIDRSGVAVRAGTHCAQPLLQRFGVGSTCRASFGMYNTEAEADALVEALEKAQAFFA